MDWLFIEILEEPFPEHAFKLFPYDVRDEQGQLTPIVGVSLEEHLERLDSTRNIFKGALKGMTKVEFYRPRNVEAYDVSPAWVVQHLMQHEAAHREQMLTLRAEAEKALIGT